MPRFITLTNMQYVTNPKFLAVLGGVLASVAVMGSGLHTWSEALTPSFVFGALGAVATALTALHLDKPDQQ